MPELKNLFLHEDKWKPAINKLRDELSVIKGRIVYIEQKLKAMENKKNV